MSVTGGSSPIALFRFAVLTLGFVTAPIVARALGPADRGLAASAISVTALIPVILSAGIPLAARRLVTLEPTDSVVRSARMWSLLLLPIAAIIGVVLNRTLLQDLASETQIFFLVGVIVGCAYISVLVDQSVLMMRKQYFRIALLQNAYPFASSAAIILIWMLDSLTMTSLLIAHMVGYVTAFAIGFRMVSVSLRGARVPLSKLVRSGLPFSGSQVAEVMHQRLTLVLAIALIGATQAGFFAIAMTIGTLPLVLGHAIGARHTHEFAMTNGADRKPLVRTALIRTVSFAGAFVLLTAILTPLALPFLFGDAFATAVLPTVISLLGGLVMAVNYVAGTALASFGFGGAITKSQLAGLLCMLGLFVSLQGSWGATGAACASLMGYLITGALLLHHLRQTTNPQGLRSQTRPSTSERELERGAYDRDHDNFG